MEPLSLGVKQSDHKADYSLPSSAEVKNVWNGTPPTICFYDGVLEHRAALPYHK
jgi:hypothetical protein